MRQEEKYYSKYHKYREFWQNNIQTIEDITKNIQNQLLHLEKKYSGFESVYDEILTQINILTAIYSSFNTLVGKEYILRLKSLLSEYKKKYSHEGINFNTIYYLHSKIAELTSKSIEEFPKLNHSKNIYIEKGKTRRPPKKIRPFKWITFYRNGSWFIIPFNGIQIIEYKNAETFSSYDTNNIFLKIDGKLIEVIDLFSKSPEWREKSINYLIIVHDIGEKCFAANRIGKKIYAKKDFVKAALQPYEKKNRISSGRIRIFGKNHIYIYDQ